jgi:hypothetical protein
VDKGGLNQKKPNTQTNPKRKVIECFQDVLENLLKSNIFMSGAKWWRDENGGKDSGPLDIVSRLFYREGDTVRRKFYSKSCR